MGLVLEMLMGWKVETVFLTEQQSETLAGYEPFHVPSEFHWPFKVPAVTPWAPYLCWWKRKGQKRLLHGVRQSGAQRDMIKTSL